MLGIRIFLAGSLRSRLTKSVSTELTDDEYQALLKKIKFVK
jgi:hypothetical protein